MGVDQDRKGQSAPEIKRSPARDGSPLGTDVERIRESTEVQPVSKLPDPPPMPPPRKDKPK